MSDLYRRAIARVAADCMDAELKRAEAALTRVRSLLETIDWASEDPAELPAPDQPNSTNPINKVNNAAKLPTGPASPACPSVQVRVRPCPSVCPCPRCPR